MDKKELISTIRTYLEKREGLVFAYIHGSFVTADRFRDIDLAIYGNPKPTLMDIGAMITDLSVLTGFKIDITLLNDLQNNSPSLAFNIVSYGELLFCTDTTLHTTYKTGVLLNYFDTAYLRDMVEKAFQERMETGNFGKRVYAS
jgi:predicted nucleotidyltransferase